MKTLLCPTDFSKNASKAIELALKIARKMGSKLVLFHVYHLPPRAPGVITAAQPGLGAAAGDKLDKLEADIQADPANAGVEVETLARPGLTVDAIEDVADELNADLIVMGTKGVTDLTEILLGTITAGVIKKVTRPILAVPSNSDLKDFSNIMFATDLEDDEDRAIKQLAQFARTFGSRIDMVHVVENEGDVSEEQKTQIETTYREKYGFDDLHLKTTVNEDVLDGLNGYIKNNPVDIVAMLTEHRNFFENLFVPSLTRQMAQYSNVPLLAFHE